MFDMQPYIVYIKPDEQNRIQSVNSSAFLTDTDGWREIDRGFDVKHHHAQGNYFPKFLYDERGIHRYTTALLTDYPTREACCIYEYDDEQWGIYERTQAEMDADWVEPVPQPDPKDQKIAELEEKLAAISAAILNI